jgi:hypothetical protein
MVEHLRIVVLKDDLVDVVVLGSDGKSTFEFACRTNVGNRPRIDLGPLHLIKGNVVRGDYCIDSVGTRSATGVAATSPRAVPPSLAIGIVDGGVRLCGGAIGVVATAMPAILQRKVAVLGAGSVAGGDVVVVAVRTFFEVLVRIILKAADVRSRVGGGRPHEGRVGAPALLNLEPRR